MKKEPVSIALLVLTVILALTPIALSEPSGTLQSVYDALVAEDSSFSQSSAMYAQYYEGVTMEAQLEDGGISIVLNSENEYVESGSWFFAEEGDCLTVTLASGDYYGMSMAQMIMSAAVSAQGVNPSLFNGYTSALTLTDQDSPYFSYEEDEASGEMKLSININGPYEMEGLDEMVMTEDLLLAQGYEPMGEDYMGRAINFGKISMVINGNRDGATFLVMEYGGLDDLAYQAITSAVKTLQPEGWEAFMAVFTELKDVEGEGFSAAINVDEADAREIIEDLPEEYSFAIIQIIPDADMYEAEANAGEIFQEEEITPFCLNGTYYWGMSETEIVTSLGSAEIEKETAQKLTYLEPDEYRYVFEGLSCDVTFGLSEDQLVLIELDFDDQVTSRSVNDALTTLYGEHTVVTDLEALAELEAMSDADEIELRDDDPLTYAIWTAGDGTQILMITDVEEDEARVVFYTGTN